MRAVTSAYMRRLDQRAVSRYGIPVFLLMEHAGRAVAEAARDLLKRRRGNRVTVLCGGGHNGADGVVAARWLAGWGYAVQVLWLKNPREWTGAAQAHYDMARRQDVSFRPFRRGARLTGDLIIDALLGTGTKGALRESYRVAIEAINCSGRPVLAVDLPSGLDADTGKSLGAVVHAACTVTMALPKKGLLRRAAQPFTGRLIVADIGCPH